MRILLAMSGGIDSSVLAHMLCAQGHEVIGVRFTLWIDPLAPAIAQVLPSKCCTTQNIHRANVVAKKLRIPLHILDLEDEFKRTVVDPYLAAYAEGKTPNPCIGCNRTIKFGRLLDFMREHNCEKLATGHYARVEQTEGGVRLLRATDTRKDQSYYLYGLSQMQLTSVMFPLGTMRKQDVFSLAKEYGVPLPDTYQESQDLCFFPEKRPKEFLMRHLKDSLQSGDIVHRDGTVLGTHQGIALYTLGQRHGLRIGGLTIPLEVVAKDHKNQKLIVAEKGTERWASIELHDFTWCTPTPSLRTSGRYLYQCRSLGARKWCTVEQTKESRAKIHFDEPESPLAPGQSIVLSLGEEVVGGGVIQEYDPPSDDHGFGISSSPSR